MKILVLAPDIPATSRMPGSPRLFNLCRELSRGHQLLLAAHCCSRERLQAFVADPAASSVFSKIEVLPDAPPVLWWGQQWHRMHLAAHFETRYRNGEYYRSIRDRISALCRDAQVDMIYVDLLVMAQYVDPTLKIPAFVDLHDSMTLMARRMLDVERNWRRRLALHLHMFRIRMLEGSLGKTFKLVVTNSTVDEQVIRELCGTTNTLTITNGVDMQYFAPEAAPVNNDKVVFTGVMGYAPNEDAAMYFAEDIFPLVKGKRPKAEFWIVGSEPSEKVRALAKMPGIHVTGKVDDVRPYVRSAAVFVSPLRIGSGVKNKILAAMAMKKATVATTLSIDGLNLSNNREVLLADEPQDFADKVLHLLADRETALQLGANGLARVQGQYSWAAMGEAMDSAIRSVWISRNGRPT